MRVNEHTALLTDRVLLVPYSSHHVPTYHEWMQDAALREATASEPLTLEEEYAMQRSWRNDADKLTFIVCERSSNGVPIQEVTAGVTDAPDRMIGDVNLFIGLHDDEDEGKPARIVCELELMIARIESQRQGLGRHILLTFMWYVLGTWDAVVKEYRGSLSLYAFSVKIGTSNQRSLRLFEKLGFEKTTSEPNYFDEWELRWMDVQDNRAKLLNAVEVEVGDPKILKY